MKTKLKFKNGPFDGHTDEVEFEPIANASKLKADSATLEFPHGLGIVGALRLKQVRVIEEKESLASWPGKMIRYRNAGNGFWEYVPHAQ